MQNYLALLASAALFGASIVPAHAQDRSPWLEEPGAEARVFIRIPLSRESGGSESAFGLGVYRGDAICGTDSAAFTYAACTAPARRGVELRISNDIISLWATGAQDSPLLAWGDTLMAEGGTPDRKRSYQSVAWVIVGVGAVVTLGVILADAVKDSPYYSP